MSSRFAAAAPTGVAVCCALLSAVVHLVIAPEHLAETLYIGILFIAGSVALLLTAGALALWNSVTAWWAGALVSGGMILGFVLSRTIGLPGYHEQGWDPRTEFCRSSLKACSWSPSSPGTALGRRTPPPPRSAARCPRADDRADERRRNGR